MLKLGTTEAQRKSAGPFSPKPPFNERPTFVLWPATRPDPAAEEARFVAAGEPYVG